MVRFEQRCLVVERVAGVRYEDGGYAERVAYHECRRRYVPCGVAARLERVAYAAVGEARRVGLLLYEYLARKLLYHAAAAVVLYESVVLFGSAAGKGMEPVSVVRRFHVHGPLSHALGYAVGDVAVERQPFVDGFGERFVDPFGKVFLHPLTIENVDSEQLRRTGVECFEFDGFAAKSLGQKIESQYTHSGTVKKCMWVLRWKTIGETVGERAREKMSVSCKCANVNGLRCILSALYGFKGTLFFSIVQYYFMRCKILKSRRRRNNKV